MTKKEPTAKQFPTADKTIQDSFRLARKVWDSGYKPTFLLCLWRGGTPIGICVHELLRKKGVKMKHLAVKAESYEVVSEGKAGEVVSIGPFNITIKSGERLLIVDDVFESGAPIERLLTLLKQNAEDKKVETKIATVYYKPKKGTNGKPDYFLHETNDRIIFPYELTQMSDAEIKQINPELYDIAVKD